MPLPSLPQQFVDSLRPTPKNADKEKLKLAVEMIKGLVKVLEEYLLETVEKKNDQRQRPEETKG